MAAQRIGRLYELQQEVKPREPYVWTAKVKIQPPTRRQMIELAKAETEDARDRIVLGAHYEEIEAHYADRPMEEWIAFLEDLTSHFFGPGADDVEGKSQDSSA